MCSTYGPWTASKLPGVTSQIPISVCWSSYSTRSAVRAWPSGAPGIWPVAVRGAHITSTESMSRMTPGRGGCSWRSAPQDHAPQVDAADDAAAAVAIHAAEAGDACRAADVGETEDDACAGDDSGAGGDAGAGDDGRARRDASGADDPGTARDTRRP